MSLLVCICFIFLPNYFIGYSYDVILLATFIMNFVPALVLFDSSVSQSFVSTSLYRVVSVARKGIAQHLKVVIAINCMLSATEVYRDCLLENFLCLVSD